MLAEALADPGEVQQQSLVGAGVASSYAAATVNGAVGGVAVDLQLVAMLGAYGIGCWGKGVVDSRSIFPLVFALPLRQGGPTVGWLVLAVSVFVAHAVVCGVATLLVHPPPPPDGVAPRLLHRERWGRATKLLRFPSLSAQLLIRQAMPAIGLDVSFLLLSRYVGGTSPGAEDPLEYPGATLATVIVGAGFLLGCFAYFILGLAAMRHGGRRAGTPCDAIDVVRFIPYHEATFARFSPFARRFLPAGYWAPPPFSQEYGLIVGPWRGASSSSGASPPPATDPLLVFFILSTLVRPLATAAVASIPLRPEQVRGCRQQAQALGAVTAIYLILLGAACATGRLRSKWTLTAALLTGVPTVVLFFAAASAVSDGTAASTSSVTLSKRIVAAAASAVGAATLITTVLGVAMTALESFRLRKYAKEVASQEAEAKTMALRDDATDARPLLLPPPTTDGSSDGAAAVAPADTVTRRNPLQPRR